MYILVWKLQFVRHQSPYAFVVGCVMYVVAQKHQCMQTQVPFICSVDYLIAIYTCLKPLSVGVYRSLPAI